MPNEIPKYMRNRFDEIREGLDPVLKDLGLTDVFVGRSIRHTGYEVFFETKRPHRPDDAFSFSPLTIIFDGERETRKSEADWSTSVLGVEDWRTKPLGKTGWRHRRKWDDSVEKIEGEGDARFAWLRKKIRARGAIEINPLSPDVVYSEMLADVFWQIGRKIPDLAVVRYPNQFDEPMESLTFLGHDGARIHLQFALGHSIGGSLYKDGEEISRFHIHSASQVAQLALILSTGGDGIQRHLYQRRG